MAITRAQQARQMLKKGSKEPVEQAGVMNYMPSEMVTVPKIAKSSPEHPTAKLAYITDAEKKLLIKKNLHGSLKGKPNRGPGGIPSLQGDFGTPGGFVGGGGGRQDDDVSGRRDTGTGDYRDSTRPDDVAARRKYEKNRAAREKAAQTIIKPDFEGPDRGPLATKTAAQQKAFRDFYKGMGLGDDAILADLTGEDDDQKPVFDFASLAADDPVNIFADDKKQELVESAVNQPINLPDFPGATSLIANAFKNQLQKNAANLRQGIVDLSDRFSKERTINYPKFMTKDGKQMSFDANLRTKSNLLSSLLDEYKNEYLDDPKKNFTYDGPDKKTGRIDLYDLKPEDQKQILKEVLDARLQGLTDAAGNLKAGVRIEKIPFRKADGKIEYRNQIIDNRDDRGGGSDPVTITSNPELLKLQKENKDLQNQLAQQDQNRFFRLMAEGGMTEDAPVGGIMDLETGRQMYFLGKLVKKATRAVKKIVKSPIGKAALGFAAFKFGPGIGTFLKDKALDFGLYKAGEGLTGKGMFSLAAALTAAPLLFQQEEEDDPMDPALLGPRLDIPGILANPYQASLGGGFRRTAADGGRIGYKEGTIESGAMMSEKEMKKLAKSPLYKGFKKMYGVDPSSAKDNPAYDEKFSVFETLFKKGYQKGGDVEPVAKKTMPLLDMDGQEMDLRDNGGFVPIGRMEKADDVPARLSKNEFVFTADAVRNAGDGDIDKGAEVMYNMMKNLEDGGNVSEESQGLEGARNMFQTAQRLEEVL